MSSAGYLWSFERLVWRDGRLDRLPLEPDVAKQMPLGFVVAWVWVVLVVVATVASRPYQLEAITELS